MTQTEIAHLRLHSQHLASAPFATAAEAVAWFGAVQAQDYFGSLWAVGQRMQQAREPDVEQAMASGAIVRTHPCAAPGITLRRQMCAGCCG